MSQWPPVSPKYDSIAITESLAKFQWIISIHTYTQLENSQLQVGGRQVLRNAVGGGVGVSAFPGKSVMKVYDSALLALRGGGWGSNLQEKALCITSMAPNGSIIDRD